ncbi:MAG TPA: phosphatidylglycerol lysyltransferase domain-containing protein, partial [Mycobacterium sp.]|nr:phosphatidylglycerol lysyltransferase domain-containing protein [Mycobacterium sp.]
MAKLPNVTANEHIVVDVDSRAARRLGALALILVFAWLVVLLERGHLHANWQADGRWAWSLTMLAVVALIARGIYLGRPVTAAHAAAAACALVAGVGAHLLDFDLVGDVVIAGAGLALMWPTSARQQPDALARVWPLVDATHADPLAPFAMHSRKSTFFNSDGKAMLAYRTRGGFAVVSGDPIGDSTQFGALVNDFAAMCHSRGWRILVLGCSQLRLPLWANAPSIAHGLRPVPVGRDVVIDVERFEMVGRQYRNLRQAVQRTRNAGVTTEVVAERDLQASTRAELIDVLDSSRAGVRFERGFSMILDGAL